MFESENLRSTYVQPDTCYCPGGFDGGAPGGCGFIPGMRIVLACSGVIGSPGFGWSLRVAVSSAGRVAFSPG